MQLGLFQLSLGILILGLLNRLLIQGIQLPAVLAALALMLWAGAEQSIPFCGLPLACLVCRLGCV